MAHWAPSRHVVLDGAVNVRDVGGYRTSYGLEVALGRLFRGDALSQLSGLDTERLDRLGLRTVIYFRDAGRGTADQRGPAAVRGRAGQPAGGRR
jgi:protein-tyrosine phosphatase